MSRVRVSKGEIRILAISLGISWKQRRAGLPFFLQDRRVRLLGILYERVFQLLVDLILGAIGVSGERSQRNSGIRAVALSR